MNVLVDPLVVRLSRHVYMYSTTRGKPGRLPFLSWFAAAALLSLLFSRYFSFLFLPVQQVMSTPETSAAFEEFSRKALCQESFLFLRDVAT